MKDAASFETVVTQLTAGPTASAPWPKHDLTFSFPTTLAPEHQWREGFSPLNAKQMTNVRVALAAFEDVADLTFTEVAANDGDMQFHNLSSRAPGTAEAGGPETGAAGDVFFAAVDTEFQDLVNPRPIGLGHGFVTYMHEIGHAMGLGHSGDYNGGSPTYEADSKFLQDDEQYSVMSYFSRFFVGSDMLDANGKERFAQTLMLYDIAALQRLYGANTTTRATDTVYGFNSNAGGFYDFSVNDFPIVCIWDANGEDALDFSGYQSATRMDLREGRFSDTPFLTKNVSIAFGTTIENAIGGRGGDRIVGNEVANHLKGGKGNDKLNGLLGNDTLVGGADRDIFVFSSTPGAANADRIVGFVATDDVIHLERSKFKAIAKADHAALKDGQFHASPGGQAHDASDRILYSTSDGKLYWDRDGDGLAYAAEHFATLRGHPALGAADFLLV